MGPGHADNCRASRKVVVDGIERFCCFIDPDDGSCEFAADYAIYGESNHPDDYTDTCDSHLEEMIGTPSWLTEPNRSWTLYLLEGDPESERIEK